MKVVTLIENTKIPQSKDLHKEAGLALCIYSAGQQILFDTGMSGDFLPNAQRLNVDIARVNLAVVSHHHLDHGGGLAAFLEANNHAKIYLKSSRTEDFDFDFFGLFRRKVGLDAALFQKAPQRFVFTDQFFEIAPGVFILTKIEKQHPTPKGNRHLYMSSGKSRQLDDFAHELILVVKDDSGLVVFTGCSHNGILNMLDAVVAQFPGQHIKAIFGGFHQMDLPMINSMAGSKEDVEELGRELLKYPVDKIFTGHCTGQKAYRILKDVMGSRLDYFTTGSQIEI